MIKILVIDDERMIRTIAVRILQRADYEIFTAVNGFEGLACFRRERPDLVITDIIMPEREGIETIRHMKRERPDTKIIAMSGGGRLGDADFLSMARELGASDVIRKPFDPRELLDRVAQCLGERTASPA
jgi:DNA-binding response OmpR family regulator